MTKEELQRIIGQQPERVSFGKGFEWYTKPLKMKPWCKIKDITNIMEFIPDNAIEEDHLAIDYDNAYVFNQGQTPSKEDYEQLQCVCEKINIEGDNGILLSKDGKYLYFAEGKYWTSSFEKDNIGKIHPIHMVVSNGNMKLSTELGFRVILPIMCINKDDNK